MRPVLAAVAIGVALAAVWLGVDAEIAYRSDAERDNASS